MSKLIFNFIINNIFIISIFQAYKIANIQGFPITPVIISILLSVVFMIFNIKKLNIRVSIHHIILYLLMMYILINFLINSDSEITSMLLFFLFAIFYCISYRRIDKVYYEKIISTFINIMVLLALFGIYQFWGRNFGVPYIDPYIDGYMVQGYNWTTQILIGGKFYWRSNSIFIEASVFSQYLGLTIMLIYNKLVDKQCKIDLLKLTILIIAFITSFSGTGVLVIIAVIGFNLLLNKNRIRYFIITFIILIIGYTIVSNIEEFSQINNYFIQRFNELINDSGSGGIRYVGTFELLKESITNKPLIGYGMGTSENVANILGNSATNLVGNTIVRVGIELGIIGLVMYLLFLLTFIISRYKVTGNKNYNTFLIFSLIQIMNSDMFLDPIYWALLYFINIDFDN